MLRAQVANSHWHFRSRLNAVNACARMRQAGPPHRTVHSIQMAPNDDSASPLLPPPLSMTTILATKVSANIPSPLQIMTRSMISSNVFHRFRFSPSISSASMILTESPLKLVFFCHRFSADDSFVVCHLAETYDVNTASVYAHADNGSMACTDNDAKLLFTYRPLVKYNHRLFDADDHVLHCHLGVGFLCVPMDDRVNGGSPTVRFHTNLSHSHDPRYHHSASAISKQLKTSLDHMSSHSDNPGFIHFPHRLCSCQDIYVSLQPTSQQGGLTFTQALTLPTDKQHLAPVPPWPTRIICLCSDHSPDPSPSVLDPTDARTCQACHDPPALPSSMPCQVRCPSSAIPDFRKALCQKQPPSDNNGPELHGCGMMAEDDIVISSLPQEPMAKLSPTHFQSDSNLSTDLIPPPLIPWESPVVGPEIPPE